MFRTKAGRHRKFFGNLLESHYYQSKHYPGNWFWDEITEVLNTPIDID